MARLRVLLSLFPLLADNLQDLIALIAYQEPEKSPMGNLMLLERRELIAESVNCALMRAQGENPAPQLEHLIRQLTVVSAALAEKNVRRKK